MNNRPSPYESAALPLSYTGVPPHGFEPRSPHSKCGILPLDEGGGNRLRGTAAVLPKGYARALRSRRKGKSPGGVGAHPGLSKRSTGGRGVGGPIERSFVACPTGAGWLFLRNRHPAPASSLEHDLFRKPVSTPDQVWSRLFRDHALRVGRAAHQRRDQAGECERDREQAQCHHRHHDQTPLCGAGKSPASCRVAAPDRAARHGPANYAQCQDENSPIDDAVMMLPRDGLVIEHQRE